MKKLMTIVTFAVLASTFAMASATAEETAKVFKFYCAQCHGLEGKGDGPNVTKDFPVSPRNFTNAKEMDKLSDADLKNVIMDGGPAVSKSPMMPPSMDRIFHFQKILTDRHFTAIIRKSKGRDILAACGQLKGAFESKFC